MASEAFVSNSLQFNIQPRGGRRSPGRRFQSFPHLNSAMQNQVRFTTISGNLHICGSLSQPAMDIQKLLWRKDPFDFSLMALTFYRILINFEHDTNSAKDSHMCFLDQTLRSGRTKVFKKGKKKF